LYGANISDILTRFTHPILDVIGWLSYGVIHYVGPFVVAAFFWLFRTKEVLHLWARVFGYMNLTGVIIQILFPCAAPWYELIYGLTPANYTMRGSAGGLARIDAIFHSKGYTTAFGNSPLVFGAFPSLHAGCATLEALFLSHFFPQTTRYIWGYAGVLYWATMYLTHHYLIDVVGGACLATAFFYIFLPDEFRGSRATTPPGGRSQRSKYEIYDLEAPRLRGNGRANSGLMNEVEDFDLASETSSRASDEQEVDITFRSPVPGATPTSAMGMMSEQQQKSAAQQQQQQQQQQAAKKSHRHTASIASLIRADERAEDGWSPIRSGGFTVPPTPTRMETEEGRK
jgi:membrane-associated phospholipid phosphatase